MKDPQPSQANRQEDSSRSSLGVHDILHRQLLYPFDLFWVPGESSGLSPLVFAAQLVQKSLGNNQRPSHNE